MPEISFDSGLATPLDLGRLLAPMATDALVLHVGPGGPGDFGAAGAYPACAARVVLIEGDPERAADLAAGLAGRDRVTVLTGALAGGGRLRRYSLGILDGFAEPAPALARMLPGLDEESSETVPALDTGTLADALGPRGGDADLLILETLGTAGAILERLAGMDALDRFARIVVRGARVALFEGEPDAAALAGWLDARGFRAEEAPDAQGTDLPLLVCHRTRAAAPSPAPADPEASTEETAAALREKLAAAEAALEAERERASAEDDRTRAEHDHLQYRLRRSREELHKAVGQIELIRDLLLRDPQD